MGRHRGRYDKFECGAYSLVITKMVQYLINAFVFIFVVVVVVVAAVAVVVMVIVATVVCLLKPYPSTMLFNNFP
jgi:hypothetical protein